MLVMLSIVYSFFQMQLIESDSKQIGYQMALMVYSSKQAIHTFLILISFKTFIFSFLLLQCNFFGSCFLSHVQIKPHHFSTCIVYITITVILYFSYLIDKNNFTVSRLFDACQWRQLHGEAQCVVARVRRLVQICQSHVVVMPTQLKQVCFLFLVRDFFME